MKNVFLSLMILMSVSGLAETPANFLCGKIEVKTLEVYPPKISMLLEVNVNERYSFSEDALTKMILDQVELKHGDGVCVEAPHIAVGGSQIYYFEEIEHMMSTMPLYGEPVIRISRLPGYGPAGLRSVIFEIDSFGQVYEYTNPDNKFWLGQLEVKTVERITDFTNSFDAQPELEELGSFPCDAPTVHFDILASTDTIRLYEERDCWGVFKASMSTTQEQVYNQIMNLYKNNGKSLE